MKLLMNERVSRLQKRVEGAKGRLSLQRRGKHSNCTRDTPYKEGCTLLDVSDFNHILEIDRESKLLIAEPLVTMEQMVAATLPHQLVPEVVPEFRGITVGGAMMGAALESSSHKYGQFNDTVAWCEVILGNGELLRLSPDENSDLFYTLAGSYGTLCILTRIAIRLIPAKPYVHLTFQQTTDPVPLMAQNEAEFVDGLVLGPRDAQVIRGNMVEEQCGPLVRMRPWSEWFFQRAYRRPENFSMPLTDYLFRLDLGAFWMGQFVAHPNIFWAYLRKRGVPKDRMEAYLRHILRTRRPNRPGPLFRTLFGSLMSSKPLYTGLHSMPDRLVQKSFLIQDSIMPLETAAQFIEHVGQQHQTYPLWLCPMRRTTKPQFLSPHVIPSAHPVALNVGTYGVSAMGNARAATIDLEERVAALGGRKALYSHSYYTPEAFWTLYDRPTYEAIRQRYHAETAFPSVEEKVLF